MLRNCRKSSCHIISLFLAQVARGAQHTEKTFEEGGKAEQSEYGKKTREWSKKQVWIKAL